MGSTRSHVQGFGHSCFHHKMRDEILLQDFSSRPIILSDHTHPTLNPASCIPPAPSSQPPSQESKRRKPLARRKAPAAGSSAAAPPRPPGRCHAGAAPLHALRSAPSGRRGRRSCGAHELIMGSAQPAARLCKELTETYCTHCTSLSFI